MRDRDKEAEQDYWDNHPKERFLDTPIKLGAFKDGVADGLLEGHRSSYHPDMYSYKQGYDFGLAMYNRLKESE